MKNVGQYFVNTAAPDLVEVLEDGDSDCDTIIVSCDCGSEGLFV